VILLLFVLLLLFFLDRHMAVYYAFGLLIGTAVIFALSIGPALAAAAFEVAK